MKNLIVPTIILLFLASCGSKQTVTQKPSAPIVSGDSVAVSAEQLAASGIVVGQIENRALSGGIPVTGMLDVPPQNLVNVTVPLGGFLRSTQLLQGMRVAKGQVIAVIENPDYVQIQQDYLDTKSQVSFLTKEFERQEKLAAENVNAQKTLQKSLADLESMKARNAGLKAKLHMLGIDAGQLVPESIRSTIELRSTMSGFVSRMGTSVGAFVSPTEVMFTIVDTEHVHLELTCFERDISRIRIGQKIRFMLAYETEERTATVFLIGKEITAERTIRVHGHLDKEDTKLIPGMYVKAIIQSGAEMVPSLPDEAVLNFEDKQVIFAQVADGIFKMVPVTTGIREKGFVQISTPEGFDKTQSPIAIRNAYKLLSKLKSSEAEE